MHNRPTPDTRPHRHVLFGLVGVLAIIATACGASSDADVSAGVASLEDVAVADDAPVTTNSEESDVAPDEAALQFSACMREQGLDFPDIGLDSDGNPDIRSAFEGVDRRGEEFRDAMAECRSILEGAGFGGGGRAAIADNVEVQDALVEFSDCVRDDGWDVGDLELGGRNNGGGDAAADEAPRERGNEAGGERREGFGNRNNRFATGLGLDPEDPDVQATMEQCAPIIEEAFSNAGVGPGRNN